MTGRVLHLLSQRPGWTGSGVALDSIVRAAAGAGWEQCVVVGVSGDSPTTSVGGLADSQVRSLVFENDQLPFLLPGMSDVMPYPSSRFSKLSRDELHAYRQAWRAHLRDAINYFQPDVIHSHHIWIMSSMVKDIAGEIPVVTHCHGTGLRQLALCPHLANEVTTGCERNDAFLVLHQGHADELVDLLRVPAERIRIVGSGFREDIFHANGRSSSTTPTITYAGKLSHAKGVPWLLDAIELVKTRIPNAELHVAGSGSGDEATVIRERLARSKDIVFHGQVDQLELAALLRRSDVFVLPSFYEGLPLVLVEAAACGCRLVSTALPGVVNQLGPQLGEVIETVPLPRLRNTDQPLMQDMPVFTEQLATAIERSLSRPPVSNTGEAVAGMTWNAVFQHVEDVWRKARGTLPSA